MNFGIEMEMGKNLVVIDCMRSKVFFSEFYVNIEEDVFRYV